MIKDILNKEGIKIGELSLPDDTPQSVWDEKLLLFCTLVPQVTAKEIVLGKIKDATEFGTEMLLEGAAENVLLGITQEGKTKVVSDFLGNLQVYLKSGSLYAALDELRRILAEGHPIELEPYVTEDRLNSYINRINKFLGI